MWLTLFGLLVLFLVVKGEIDLVGFLTAGSWLEWLATLLGLAIYLVVAGILLWFLYGETTFVLGSRRFWIVKWLFFLRTEKVVGRPEVKRFYQVKDGGEDGAAFPTWGLLLKASADATLLARQPLDKSDWLGPLLADHYGLPYIPTDRRSA